jgi:nucleolar protein 6
VLLLAMTKENKEAPPTTASKKKFIAFFGNLAFSTTVQDIKTFLGEEADSFQIRLLTKKGSNESRGAAFVEFPTAAALQTALALVGTSLNGRSVRIEPTVGGGGRSEARKTKLTEKKKNFSIKKDI